MTAVVAVAILGMALVAAMWRARSAAPGVPAVTAWAPLNAGDWVVVASFENQTGEEILDGRSKQPSGASWSIGFRPRGAAHPSGRFAEVDEPVARRQTRPPACSGRVAPRRRCARLRSWQSRERRERIPDCFRSRRSLQSNDAREPDRHCFTTLGRSRRRPSSSAAAPSGPWRTPDINRPQSSGLRTGTRPERESPPFVGAGVDDDGDQSQAFDRSAAGGRTGAARCRRR